MKSIKQDHLPSGIAAKEEGPMAPPPMHVDDFIQDFQQDAYARFFFHLHRLPAAMKNDFSPWSKQFQLYCTYLGSRFRVVGASRMGDVWLNANFKEDTSYELRVDVEKCSAWGPKP